MPIIYCELTPRMVHALCQGKTTTWSVHTEGAICKLDCDAACEKRFNRAKKSGRNVRLSGHIVKGSSSGHESESDEGESMHGGAISAREVGRTISRGFKQLAPKAARRNIGKLEKAIKRSGLDRQLLKVANNEGVDFLTGLQHTIDPSAITGALKAGASGVLTGINAVTGIPTIGAIGAVNAGIDHTAGSALRAFDQTDFHKKNALKKLGRNFNDEFSQPPAVSDFSGAGIRTKGSQAAKDHMARLRAMRKKKTEGAGMVHDYAQQIEHRLNGRGFLPIGGKGCRGGGFVPI
jgi:hypothetical protein